MATEVVKFSLAMAQEYLRPPGDSSRLQPLIDGAMIRMGRDAVTLQQVTTVIIEIDPDYAEVRTKV